MSTVMTPFDEILEQLLNRCRKSATKQAQKLAQLPKEALQKFLSQFSLRNNRLSQQVEACYDTIYHMCQAALRGPHVSIEIDAGSQLDFATIQSKPVLIKGKLKFTPPGKISSQEVDCFLSCGHWVKLGPIKERKINIIDHLDKLLPKYKGLHSPSPIGLVTYQNGIMNDLDNDFRKMGELIIKHFPEGPLCIGLHNATTNFLPSDMSRFREEATYNEPSVYSLCQLMKTIAERVPKINPNVTWTHFAHSEGGLIANAVLSLCDQWWLSEIQRYIKKNLVVATYGAVKPVPSNPVLEAVNTYSKKDIALFFGSSYLDKPLDKITTDPYHSTKEVGGKTYKVTIIDSKLPFDPALKINFQPEFLTLEQRLNMSWIEWLAHLQEYEDSSPRLINALNEKAANVINEKIHAIQDHGFAQVTYQAVLEDNIDKFRDRFPVYDAKRWP